MIIWLFQKTMCTTMASHHRSISRALAQGTM